MTRLADFGAFVELEPGVEGLIPISEMTYTGRIRHPGDVVSEGDVVQVKVLSMDLDRQRISLSLKQVGEDPWMGASVRWPVGDTIEGIVMRATEFGAFVELARGVQGLVHISELSHQRVRAVEDVIKEGDRVQARVLSVDEEKHRISLSIKEASYSVGAVDAEAPEQAQSMKERKRPLKGGLD